MGQISVLVTAIFSVPANLAASYFILNVLLHQSFLKFKGGEEKLYALRCSPKDFVFCLCLLVFVMMIRLDMYAQTDISLPSATTTTTTKTLY